MASDPRWRRPPPLIDAAVVALAERRGQFLSARQLAEATGRSASGMSNALSRAFCGQHGNAIKTARGRLVRRPGRSHLPTLYLLAPAGKPLSAAAGRVASTEWLRGALFERLGL